MRRIAVIGSGVAGLTAAWALRQQARVSLFEADGRLGGHAHSHELARSDGGSDVVDSGFIVHNDATYPTLVRLFGELGVRTQPAEMSMSVACGGCGLEYAGARRISGLLPTPGNARNLRYLRMLASIPRFHAQARRLLAHEDLGGDDLDADQLTLRDFLARNRFSRYFADHFALPLVACVWSCAPGLALDYPARYLFAFLEHHGMLRVSGSPQWRTVTGGSREYVRRVASALPDVRRSAPVSQVMRHADGVDVRGADGRAETFDGAVIATHADQALSMLADASVAEKAILDAFGYSRSVALLHADESVLPQASRRARAHGSWNYRMSSCGGRDDRAVTVTYDMNRLHRIAGPDRYLVSLNAEHIVDPATVRAAMVYTHPQYTPSSVAAQRLLPALNADRLAFAGAYHGWGFHEDGARSGLAAARALGATW